MRKNIRVVLVATSIVSAFALGGTLAFAESGHGTDQRPGVSHKCDEGKRGPEGRRYLQRLAKQLGVTEQQKTQIKGIFKTFREKNRPELQAMHNEKRQLRELIMSGTADESAIRAQSAKVAAAQADLAVARASMAKQIHAVLTPEQNAKLKVLLKEREKKMEKFRERHGYHGEGHLD